MAYPPVSFYFKLKFGDDNKIDAPFQEASGIHFEIGVEEVVCGGENRFKYRLPAQNKFTNLVLKRGFVTANSPLHKWCNATFTDGLNSLIQTKTITISLLDVGDEVLVSWDFINAYPVKWSISDFKSMENGYVIESLEFAYNYFKKNT